MAKTILRFHSWVPLLLQPCTSLTARMFNCEIRAKETASQPAARVYAVISSLKI